MNWYIGQPIMAIVNHSQGLFKKGQEFTIKGLSEAMCNCHHVRINIGIDRVETHQNCFKCNTIYTNRTNYIWFNEGCFDPLDVNISELTEILEKPFELISKQ